MNIKSFTKFSNFVLVLLLISIGGLVFHSLSIREDINQRERNRLEALLLADELLQTSDDLTRMARTYVTTGKPIYEHYFNVILDIRNGKRPRPLNYSATYWHLVSAGKIPLVEEGEAISLLERIRLAGFNDEDYALLQESMANSEKLVHLERQAFAAMKGFYDDGKGNFTVRRAPNREYAISLLSSDRYIAEKASIMEPIQEFRDSFSGRMKIESDLGLARLKRLTLFEIALIFIAVLETMVIIFYTRRGILQPLAELGRQVAGITRGTRPPRFGRATSNELAKLGEALVLADTEKRQLLENERIARSEAERASQLKDEFLATLSHELRTPLNAILGWSQLILNGNMKQEDVHRGLETIERNARAQNKLIEDLLEMSSIISGKVRLDMQVLDMPGMVDAAVESVRATAQAKGIKLVKTIDYRVQPISGDSNRLQQVFWNLLSNAIKFTPRDGKIEIIVKQVSSSLEISIHDSGLGISPDFMPYVFDRFRQADASLTRQYSGLGLGLAIVKQLVELHGGTVRAESAGIGQGASFYVDLPLALAGDKTGNDLLPPRQSLFSGEKYSLLGIRVLIVDDQLDARELTKQILTHRHASVITAGSAMEGFQLLKEKKPNVLISDIGMPGKNGYELIRAIRMLAPESGGRIPAIALTAFARPEDRISAMNAGFQEYLTKPVEAANLIAAINNLIGRQNESGE
jgi:signal transduction histidine kinase/ActR/RegA family two-component response regulator